MDRVPHNFTPFPTGGWPEHPHPQATVEDAEEGDGWGGGADASSAWEQPRNDWGTIPANDWDNTTGVHDWGGTPAAPGGWDEPVTDDGWGPSAAVLASGGQGGHPAGSRGRSRSRQGGAQSNPQPPSQQPARAPANPHSLHPSAHAHQMSPAGWGPPAPAWGTDPPRPSWAQPPAPKPPGHKPAWTKWASEAKLVNTPPVHATPAPYDYATQAAASGGGTRQVLSEQQRSQLLSSLLAAPQQQTKGSSPQSPPQAIPRPRQQPTAHPGQSQTYMHAQFLAEQQGILRSIQEANMHSNGHAQHDHSQQSRQGLQYADSWTNWGRDGYGAERASTIPEEDEYEDDGWGDTEDEEEDDGWGQSHGYDNNQRVRFSSNVSYAGTPSIPSRTPSHGAAPASGAIPPRQHVPSNPQMWAASPNASRTMRIATGTLSPTPNTTVKTTVFELPPPRNGFGENAFASSHGESLVPAMRAMYNQGRPTKERIRWGFNPDKDPRVSSLLRWVAAMSNGLAEIGLQRFLDTQERGALFANADFRVPATHGSVTQPAFDWVTLTELQNTLDSTLQSSVTLYDPAYQVIVFVFLLSPSGNSMAVWRRKLNIPDSLRGMYEGDILAVKAGLKTSYPVYVDELPVKPGAATPTAVKKKKVRFAFIRRIFGGGKKAAAA